ncbi:MAG: ribose-phosphate diphosphokinase, partial [Bdellovibrionota bacterium]
MEPNLSLFALPSSRPLAEGIAHRLGIPLSELREEQFPDGEKKISPMHSVERESVVLFQSLLGEAGHSPNEKICELLFLLHTLRDHGAREITLVAPYLAYARSDIRHDALDSLYLKSLAEMLESAGLGRLITLDVHNPAAFENAFRYCIAQNLEASSLFCKYLKKLEWSNAPLVVLSPDLGGIKRAAKFHTRLEQALGRTIQFSFLEKY